MKWVSAAHESEHFIVSVAFSADPDIHSERRHLYPDRQTDRPTNTPCDIPRWSISRLRRGREQSHDITFCRGQSHRNGLGTCRNAVLAITNPTTAKKTHPNGSTLTHTVHNDTIVDSKLSISPVCWHTFDALCICVRVSVSASSPYTFLSLISPVFIKFWLYIQFIHMHLRCPITQKWEMIIAVDFNLQQYQYNINIILCVNIKWTQSTRWKSKKYTVTQPNIIFQRLKLLEI